MALQHLEKKLLEILTVAIQHGTDLHVPGFQENLGGIQIADITLTSLAVFSTLLSKRKLSTSQECKAAKCDAACAHLHVGPSATPAASVCSFRRRQKRRSRGTRAFPVWGRLHPRYANKTKSMFSLCPKRSVTSNDEAERPGGPLLRPSK